MRLPAASLTTSWHRDDASSLDEPPFISFAPSQSPHAAVHSYGIVALVASSCSGCEALSMPLGEKRRSTEQSPGDADAH